MKDICRTCLSSSNKLSSVEIDENLKNKIELLTTIQISQDYENFPSTICQNCVDNVNKYYGFRAVVIEADKELKEHLKTRIREREELKKIGRRKRKYLLKDSAIPKRRKTQKDANKLKIDIKQESRNTVSEGNKEFCDEISNKRVTRQSNKLSSEIENFQVDFIKKELRHEIILPSKNGSRIRNEDEELENFPNHDSPFHNLSDEENTNIKQKCNLKNCKENGKNHSSLTCEDCNIMFSTSVELINHKRSLHTAPGICNICGAVVRADNLSKHVLTHNEGPAVCKICGKLLKNSQSLRTHSLIHKGTIYTCDVCGRTSKVKSEHSRHMKIHVDPNARKTMCTICGKRVRHLKHHVLTHTGEKPHVCRHCNKGFTSTYNLKVHSRQHTNEKPFICECCSMGFNQKISLLSHLKSKHGASNE